MSPSKVVQQLKLKKHAGEDLTSQVISDITKGEHKITGGERLKGGPTSTAQSIASQAQSGNKSTSGASSNSTSTTANSASGPASGVLDSATISKITEKEREITGQDEPVKGGPTAQAQKHANEPITSQVLHDITECEKKIAGDRLKGGPTAAAQSELGKARNAGNA